MKAVKRRTILLVVAIALVLSMTVGLTLAYFSDSTAAEGGIPVTLGGQTTIVEKQPTDNSKYIQILNTGDTDVVVRVSVFGPTEITYDGEGWTEGNSGYWYYDSILHPEELSDPITATWKVPEDLGDDYNVVVIQESDQVVYDNDG